MESSWVTVGPKTNDQCPREKVMKVTQGHTGKEAM